MPSEPEPSPQDETSSPQPLAAPIIPIVHELKAQAQSGIPVEITQTISRVKPDVALDYVDKWVNLDYQDRDKERAHQLQLAQAKLALEEKKEANQATDRAADRKFIEGVTRWGFGTFLSVIFSAFAFAYAVKDSDGKIVQTVLSFTAGVAGGTGVSAGWKSKTNTQGDAHKKSE